MHIDDYGPGESLQRGYELVDEPELVKQSALADRSARSPCDRCSSLIFSKRISSPAVANVSELPVWQKQ